MRTVLLISRHPDDRSFAEGVSRALERPLITVGSPEEAASVLDQDPGSFEILADVSSQSQFVEVRELLAVRVGRQCERLSANQVHLITNDETAEAMTLSEGTFFEHLIIRKYGDLGKAGGHYGRIVRAYSSHDRICLEHLISEGVRQLDLQHTNEKHSLLDRVREDLTEVAGYSRRIAETIVSALDELLMNAIYDAPARSEGQDAPDLTARTEPVELRGRRSVGIKYAQDDEYSAFSVSDNYGSIDRDRLFKYILRSFRQKSYVVDDSKAGAGLGLAMTFRSGGSFLFVAEPGRRTEVTVFFKRTRSYTDFKDQFRFVSVHLSSLPAKR